MPPSNGRNQVPRYLWTATAKNNLDPDLDLELHTLLSDYLISKGATQTLKNKLEVRSRRTTVA